MSDGKITLRFNGNPNTVNSNQSAPVSQVDIGLADSNEIKLKQVSKPVAAVAPTQNRESDISLKNGAPAAKKPGTSNFVQPKKDKPGKKIITKSELKYRLHVILSIIIILLVLAVLAMVAVGGFSVYAVYQVSENPKKGEIIYDTAKAMKRTSDWSKKYTILSTGVKKFMDVKPPVVKESEEKSLGGTLRAIRDSSKAGESALKSDNLHLKK